MKAVFDAQAGVGAAARSPMGQAGRATMPRVAGRPLRICFVTQFGYPVLAGSRTQQIVGGAEVQQALISAELARRGHQVSMISLDFGQTEGERVRGVRMVKTHAMDAGLTGMRFVHPRMTRLWSALKRADADIYYQRSSGAYTGVVGEFARRHGRHMVFASSAATDFDPALPRLKFRRDKWLYRYGLRRASRVVVQSATQLDDCQRHFGITPVQIPSCYAHRGNAARHDGPILWVGNTRDHKRPDLFVELAARLPEYRFRLVGGSSVDDRLFNALAERARGLSNLELAGFVPYVDVEAQFDGACMIVNTSPAEGFPNTFLQAWSRGAPSLSFFDVGARLDGETVGEPVADLDQMAQAVRRLKSDARLWAGQGERAARYVAEHHSLDRVVDRYETVFAGLEASFAGARVAT
jgi:glycosyltransferase involved in cell wall biosynthesis